MAAPRVTMHYLMGKVFIVALMAICSLLSPAEAGFMDWLNGKVLNRLPGPKKGGSASNRPLVTSGQITSGGKSSNVIFSPGVTTGDNISFGNILITGDSRPTSTMVFDGPMTGSWSQINFGSIYEVTIQHQKGKNGECEEKVIIGLSGKKIKKTLDNKCSGNGVSRKIRNIGDLLLIGNPDDKFCLFTTNKNEIYYLQNGKWKKGDFSGDNSKDKELTTSEVAKVNERIKNWQAFFEKSDKEMQRIRDLRTAKREKHYEEKGRIRALKGQDRQTHFQNVNQIYQLRNQEYNKHNLERNKIYNRRNTEGWSTAVEKLLSEENKRHEKKLAELDDIRKKEDGKYETEMNDYDKKLSVEDSKYDEEMTSLDALQDKEEKRVQQEMKKYINQGW